MIKRRSRIARDNTAMVISSLEGKTTMKCVCVSNYIYVYIYENGYGTSDKRKKHIISATAVILQSPREIEPI